MSERKYRTWFDDKRVLRILVCAPILALTLLTLYFTFYQAGCALFVLAIILYCLNLWSSSIARKFAEFFIILGPFMVLNPYFYVDIRREQMRQGQDPSGPVDFILYLVVFEIAFLAAVYLTDRIRDQSRREAA